MSPNNLPQYLAPSLENPAHLHWANGTLGSVLCVHTLGSVAAQTQGKEVEGRYLPLDRAGPAGGATVSSTDIPTRVDFSRSGCSSHPVKGSFPGEGMGS